MRGGWLVALLSKASRGQIGLADAARFALARFAPKPCSLSFRQLDFQELDHIGWSLIAEIFVLEAYNPAGFQIHPGDIVVDIGAHQGTFVAYAAQNTAQRIIAIEPLPENFAKLQALIQRQEWRHVELHQAAVSAGDQTRAKLYQSGASSRSSLFDFDVLDRTALTDFVEVETINLAEIVSQTPHIDFLKMDCEGGEYPIFASTPAKNWENVGKLVMEYHPAPAGYAFDGLLAKVKAGFPQVHVVPINGELGYLFAKR